MKSWTPGEKIYYPSSFKDSEDPFIRYIYYDQRAREEAKKYEKYGGRILFRRFANALAGTMALTVTEAFIASGKIQEQMMRDFRDPDKEIAIMGRWQKYHEARVEALNEIEARGYRVDVKHIADESRPRLTYPWTKAYRITGYPDSPTKAVFAPMLTMRRAIEFPGSISYWHPEISKLGTTEVPYCESW